MIKFKRPTADQINGMIALYQGGATAKESAAHYGYDLGTCIYHLKKNNIPRRPAKENHRKFSIDLTFFDTIDTEEKAYWVGFILADGCISENKINISISEKDEQHLEKFRRAANLGHSIKKHNYQYSYTKKNTKPIVSISIRSDEWIAALATLGITSNKSLNVNPNLAKIPLILHKHFWRGVFDGDGCIYLNRKKPGSHVGTLCGSKYTIMKFTNFLTDLGFPPKQSIYRNNIYQVQYQGLYLPQSLASVLYKDASVYLDRKYQLYKELISIPYELKTKYYYLAERLGVFDGSLSYL